MTSVSAYCANVLLLNRAVIVMLSTFLAAFIVATLLFGLFSESRGFCHITESDLFPFLLLSLPNTESSF